MAEWSSNMRAWASQPCLMGIDEAGRGPVLGPMVYACAYCPLTYRDALSTLEYADSKTLKESKREELFECLKKDESMGWAVDVIDPKVLSAMMLAKDRVNLNLISYNSAMGLITQVLNLGIFVTEVFVDTVGDAEKYEAELTRRFPGITFNVSKKADSLFPIVSAASIVAKVTRDRSLKDWIMEMGWETSREFGSGYPADPVTKEWLQKHRNNIFGFPTLVRFSWETCKSIMARDGIEVHWEAEQDERDSSKPKYGKTVLLESNAIGRHDFFVKRKLQQVVTQL